jgi:hypothetical protein
VALSGFLAGTAKGDSLIYGAVVTDFGGFADYDSGAVVDKNSAADFCRRMYFNAGASANNLGKSAGGEFKAVVPKPKGRTVPHYCVKSGIEKQNLEGGRRRRVSVTDCVNIFFKTGKHEGCLLSE